MSLGNTCEPTIEFQRTFVSFPGSTFVFSCRLVKIVSFDHLDRDDDSMLIAGLSRSGVLTHFGIYDVTTS